ncbi:hypothetical protein LY78DRAFT_389369 [Colletotrichum sublineola]|nr:hypothetical protein LY78DRAFT_389369 [Colletotrichum sublineola]
MPGRSSIPAILFIRDALCSIGSVPCGSDILPKTRDGTKSTMPLTHWCAAGCYHHSSPPTRSPLPALLQSPPPPPPEDRGRK